MTATPVPAPTRVGLVEDSFLLRTSLVRMLAEDARIDVVGTATGLDDALEMVERVRPDVIVTDVRMPPDYSDEGISLATRLRTTHPNTGVVVLSQHAEPIYARGLVEAGARGRGYLLKDRVGDADELVDAILTVSSGGAVLDPVIVDVLIESRMRATPTATALTFREREVLAAVASGANNHAIADQLVLSPRSVEKHINSIFAKLGLTGDAGIDRRVRAALMYLADASR